MQDRPNLEEISYPQMKKYASEIGVNANGTKEELTNRIQEKWASEDADLKQEEEAKNEPTPAPSGNMDEIMSIMAQQQKQIAQLTETVAQLRNPSSPKSIAKGKEFNDHYKNKKDRMEENLNSQEKVTIIVPLEGKEKPGTMYTVTLNGYTVYIPKNTYVEVPKQIAQVIQESTNQTRLAEQGITGGKNFSTNADQERANALG